MTVRRRKEKAASHPQTVGERSTSSKPGGALGKEATRPFSSSTTPDHWFRLKLLLGAPVSGASLAVFRIAVGIVMALEAYSLVAPNPAAISTGLSPVETYYTAGQVYFPYLPFSWLPLFPLWAVHLLVALLALAGITMALGLFYRLSAATVFLIWGYFFAVESTRSYWQSHYYLELLVTFLLIWMPAARVYSLDAWRSSNKAGPHPRTIPFWPVVVLRGQLVIAYFYAGVAKLNLDWLLDAVPVRWFLREPGVTAPYASFLSHAQLEALKSFLENPAFAYFLSYTGLIFDLAIGFLLLVRRTRILGILLMFIFHATNHFLIFDNIGWFPLVGFLTALIFLDPDWPERFTRWLRHPKFSPPDWRWAIPGGILLPVVGLSLGWKLPKGSRPAPEHHRVRNRVAFCVLLWLAFQSLMPLRHYAIPGDARFTYEGMSFSWRLKAEDRSALTHELRIVDPAIISTSPQGMATIHWEQWHGERVIYRVVNPPQLDWRLLPELIVVTEQYIGQRVLYNPFTRSSAGAQPNPERVKSLWQDLYGRLPKEIFPTRAFPEVLQIASGNFKESGKTSLAAEFSQLARATGLLEQGILPPEQASTTLTRVGTTLNEHAQISELTAALDVMHPFALGGAGRPRFPFLVISDPEIFEPSGSAPQKVAAEKWRHHQSTLDPYRPNLGFGGNPPLVVYHGPLEDKAAELLPQAYLRDFQAEPLFPPSIEWNSAKHLTASDMLHTSAQAFYLRRYARIVADLWEQQYGRRPAVHALTSLSLNARPHQHLVDPAADLASVPISWLTHNAWIIDLQTPRIPREALPEGPQ